jgi:hypothetical protein
MKARQSLETLRSARQVRERCYVQQQLVGGKKLTTSLLRLYAEQSTSPEEGKKITLNISRVKPT